MWDRLSGRSVPGSDGIDNDRVPDSASFAVWSSPLIMVMTLLMLIGGGTGSTAGGIKQIRVCIMLKSLCWSIRSKISQKRLIHADGIYRISGYEYLKAEERLEASDFILLYLGVFAAGTFILCACGFESGIPCSNLPQLLERWGCRWGLPVMTQVRWCFGLRRLEC